MGERFSRNIHIHRWICNLEFKLKRLSTDSLCYSCLSVALQETWNLNQQEADLSISFHSVTFSLGFGIMYHAACVHLKLYLSRRYYLTLLTVPLSVPEVDHTV